MSNAEEGGLTKSRIEALADGVFAVAMTLLVFEIKIPGFAPEAGQAAWRPISHPSGRIS